MLFPELSRTWVSMTEARPLRMISVNLHCKCMCIDQSLKAISHTCHFFPLNLLMIISVSHERAQEQWERRLQEKNLQCSKKRVISESISCFSKGQRPPHTTYQSWTWYISRHANIGEWHADALGQHRYHGPTAGPKDDHDCVYILFFYWFTVLSFPSNIWAIKKICDSISNMFFSVVINVIQNTE